MRTMQLALDFRADDPKTHVGFMQHSSRSGRRMSTDLRNLLWNDIPVVHRVLHKPRLGGQFVFPFVAAARGGFGLCRLEEPHNVVNSQGPVRHACRNRWRHAESRVFPAEVVVHSNRCQADHMSPTRPERERNAPEPQNTRRTFIRAVAVSVRIAVATGFNNFITENADLNLYGLNCSTLR